MVEAIILIVFTLCITSIAYLKSKLNIAEYKLKSWREMIVFINGKQRLLGK